MCIRDRIDPAWSDEDARALIGALYEVNLRTYEINQQEYIFCLLYTSRCV